MTGSLYDRIGGEPALMAAVDLFYAKVLAHELIAPFFQSLDMEAQTRKQVAFMAWAFGAPSAYKGRNLRIAHHELVTQHGLGDVHFDAVAACLEQTLVELGIERPLVDEVLGVVGATRNDVLGRSVR